MKKLIFIYIILGVGILILLGIFTIRNLHGRKIIDETRTVFIKKSDNGFQLYRNGRPFYIQGASGNSYFKELAEFGGNTIRVYDTTNLTGVLDEAEKYGLAVIVDIPIPSFRHYNFTYINEEYNRALTRKVKVLVKKYKSHPALLMWNLGNELYYPATFRKNSFIKTFNELIDIIHKEDPNHPISTALAFVRRREIASIYLHSPGIDLLSINVFGQVKDANRRLSQTSFLFGAIPYYISEWGFDGHWESNFTSWKAPIDQTSSKKSEQIKTRYNIINEKQDNPYLGSLVFYWGYKHEKTYSWYSLFKDDHKSEIIKELEKLWKKTNNELSLIGLEYMLVDGKGAADNIIFVPNQQKDAKLKFGDSQNDSFKIKWEIYPEAWSNDTTNMSIDPRKPLENVFINFDDVSATFITPGIEGPYRIFAYIYDNHGYFATTNTPFYVLNPK